MHCMKLLSIKKNGIKLRNKLTTYSYLRGHKIYWDVTLWRYVDNNNIANYDRPCTKCGRMPTKEGYDACTGYIEGVVSYCCGHGVTEKIAIYKENKSC